MILTESNDELERLRTQNRISKAKDREIEDLKAKLYQRNEQDIITSTSELHEHVYYQEYSLYYIPILLNWFTVIIMHRKSSNNVHALKFIAFIYYL